MGTSARAGFEALLTEMPPQDADFFKVLSWSHRFNAYDHWGSGPELLYDLVRPLLRHYEVTGRMPDGIGFDGIRALMFFKARQHHFTDYPPEELIQIFHAARAHVEALLAAAA